jgi:hypothetical protein
VTAPQRDELVRLARLAGVELAIPATKGEAADAIKRLRKTVREPSLELGI